MDFLQDFFTQLTRLRWSDYLDIILVGFLLYRLLPMLRSSGAVRIAKIVGLVLALTWITGELHLNTLNFLLEQVLAVGLIAVVVLFQPELRRMLDHLSGMKLKRLFGTEKPEQEMVPVITQTVAACEAMSKARIGALMVFARDSRLDEYFKTGTLIDARVSAPLFRNLFFPKAALHDGAVIVCGTRVMAAGCVLPLSETDRLNVDLGTRHRAAVGMSEVSDAVVVVVSEETGAISVAVGGMLKRHLAGQTLEKLLMAELCPQVIDENKNPVIKLKQKLQGKDKEVQGNDKK